MNTQHVSCTASACAEQAVSKPAVSKSATPHQQIKLALDVHAATIVAVRMVDGAKPQPPQTMTPAVFLQWVQKQKAQAQEVISCYEAGPTGFWLHRQLTALGESLGSDLK